MTAAPAKQSADYWNHTAADVRDGVKVTVYTWIETPARRCACGAECTHPAGAGTR